MKRWSWLIGLLLAGGCTTAPVAEPEGELDQLGRAARAKAREHYKKADQELWLFSLRFNYGADWLGQDQDMPLHHYQVIFFDPASVQANTNGSPGSSALGYHIRASTNGTFRPSGSGRGIGWSR